MGSETASIPAWCAEGRSGTWAGLRRDWDLIVIGGGITGVGVFSLAARSGLSVLLVEQGDFASGTSSRSSKLVHGGLRYLKQMQLRLTRESVQEREYLLKLAPGLVEPLPFLYPVYEGKRAESWLIGLGLNLYTHLARDLEPHQVLDAGDLSLMAPGLKTEGLVKAFRYVDASTDDARLVLRVLHDALRAAPERCLALNYARVIRLLRSGGRVSGAALRDGVTGAEEEVHGAVVVNATGAWSDILRADVGGSRRLRPLRGSHLCFPRRRFPLYQAVALNHPADHRPVFFLPWEGTTLVGTTDMDHDRALDEEPRISDREFDYLMEATRWLFPVFDLAPSDVHAVQAGVRPVVAGGKADPSEESREYAVWEEHGLLTVTGGKLTTFHHVALDVLRRAQAVMSSWVIAAPEVPILEPSASEGALSHLAPAVARRLRGRYGAAATELVERHYSALEPIPGSPYLWAELLWAAEREAVVRLDDLLMRRLRLGLLLGDGGSALESDLRERLLPLLGWEPARWNAEWAGYLSLRATTQANPRRKG